MEQETILEQPQTMDEALRMFHLVQQENEFLKRQIEVFNTMQAKAGLLLNKIKIEDLFDKIMLKCKANELTRIRIYHYKLASRYFLEWCKTSGLVYADEVTTGHTDEFWTYFKTAPGIMNPNKPLSRATRLHMWASCKAAFQYALERDSVIKNVWKNRPFPANPCRSWWDDKYFYNVLEAIDNHASRRNRPLYKLVSRGLYTTGIRVGKFSGVKNNDVIHTEDDKLILITKRKVTRSARFQDFPIEILNKKLKDDYFNYYTPSKPNKYVLIQGKQNFVGFSNQYRRMLKGEPGIGMVGVCEKAGIPYKNPHQAKHGFITKMLIQGYSAPQICKMTGTTSTRVIEETYNHLQFSDFKSEVRKIVEDI